ncbi:MAG: DUF4846 domain-containing protein [Deltaproteobacteria bacterium]|nr:DUF4846 domain-containing protein [Deltaproteobacteria bacterium]
MNLFFMLVAFAVLSCAAPGKPVIVGDPEGSTGKPRELDAGVPKTAKEPPAEKESPTEEEPPAEPSKVVVEFDPEERDYPWMETKPGDPLWKRFSPPAGYRRIPSEKGSFANWLRLLPLKPGKPPVHLYNGDLKYSQDVHVAVVDIDVGKRDLQQCADAVMRLRAEYLLAAGSAGKICFRLGRGDRATWSKWRDGFRPPKGNKRTPWERKARPNGSYRNFRKYMNKVFGLSGTGALKGTLSQVNDVSKIEIGDVFIERQPGTNFGHAVLVMDMAENQNGRRAFLLSQSYMPAQEIHILKNNEASGLSPWYTLEPGEILKTPEWSFPPDSLRRFPKKGCGG